MRIAGTEVDISADDIAAGKGKIFAGYCSGGKVEQSFMDSWNRQREYDLATERRFLGIHHEGGLYITYNRNRLSAVFMTSGAEWMLSLDTDIVWNPDMPYKLLEAADPVEKPIISGLYFGYVGESGPLMQPVPIWFQEHDDGMPYVIQQFRGGDLVELAIVGMGFCLIHRSVFEKISAKFDPEGINDWPWYGHDEIKSEGKLIHVGEDVAFCKRARAVGCRVWGHAGVIVNHVKSRSENVVTFAQGGHVKIKHSNGAA